MIFRYSRRGVSVTGGELSLRLRIMREGPVTLPFPSIGDIRPHGCAGQRIRSILHRTHPRPRHASMLLLCQKPVATLSVGGNPSRLRRPSSTAKMSAMAVKQLLQSILRTWRFFPRNYAAHRTPIRSGLSAVPTMTGLNAVGLWQSTGMSSRHQSEQRQFQLVCRL